MTGADSRLPSFLVARAAAALSFQRLTENTFPCSVAHPVATKAAPGFPSHTFDGSPGSTRLGSPRSPSWFRTRASGSHLLGQLPPPREWGRYSGRLSRSFIRRAFLAAWPAWQLLKKTKVFFAFSDIPCILATHSLSSSSL